MTGEQLYEIYIQEHENRGCGVDSWHQLDAMTQEVFNAMAQRLFN